MSDHRHHCECEHHKRNVTMPAMPGAGFIVIEPELVFGGLETVLDRPATSFDADESIYCGAGRTPGREERQVSIGDVASNQKSPCPGSVGPVVELCGVQIGRAHV